MESRMEEIQSIIIVEGRYERLAKEEGRTIHELES